MALRVDLTFDCARAAVLAEFWKLALGYEDEPEGDEDDGAWLRDPDGVGPRLVFLRVPEPKVAKNRLHIDVRVGRLGGPEQVWERVQEKVAQLVSAGGSVLEVVGTHHVVMADPEGNEFCVAG
jgi:hypothetical protein